MDPALRTEFLAEYELSRALPLIQIQWPHIDLPAWEGFVNSLSRRSPDKGAGVVALCDDDDYVCGVFLYEVEKDLVEEPALILHVFALADLANSERLAKALLVGAENIAAALACRRLRVRFRLDQAMLGVRLRALGLTASSAFLEKDVEPGELARS